MSAPGEIRLQIEPPVARIVIDNPDRRNAMNAAMYRQVPERVAQARSDGAVRVIVVEGAGTAAFGAGSDISEFSARRVGSATDGYDQAEHVAQTALRAVDLPVVAAIRGACMGGGAALAMCADLRCAADDAQFAFPPARLGIAYPVDAVATLVAAVGAPRARDLLFTGRRVGAEEALAMGLVHRVFPGPGLTEAVDDLVAQLAANAPLTIRSAKLVIAQLAKPEDERDAEAIRDSLLACYRSDDYREGINAFAEGRPPVFEGR